MFKKGDIITGEISLTGFGSGYVSTEKLKRGIFIPKNKTNKSLHSQRDCRFTNVDV